MGTKLLEIDSPNGTKGPESTSLIARSSGVYIIEVSSREIKAPPGRYEVKLEAVRIPTAQDKTADLAAFLVDTKSETDRASRMSAERELVTPQLAEELVKIGAASLRGNDAERAMIAFSQSKAIAEQTNASGQAAANRIASSMHIWNHFSI